MGTQSDVKPIPSPEDIERLPEDGGEDFNRLVFEQSPYLLQHARNPVDWYPWGDEALQRARELERPVFLSIGYSTCHWCHVMARESFENAEIAEVLNEDFVPVKVDREERPDIDRIYMDACQRITGQGGWPLTILMTPEGKPFFAGTYFPPGTSGGRQGLKQILDRISEMWENEREKVKGSADNITEALTAEAKIAGDEEIGLDVLRSGISELAERFDRQNGGFGSGQKFPSPQNLLYLLRAHHRNGDANTLEMVRKTLDAMRLGGMYDHVGGGFHRYATDPEWKVPHFEKMLYDQAMLLVAYSEGYQVMGKQLYADTIRQTIDFVNRDLRAADGGYYSALDAESEGEEGKFYVWDREEWIDTIGNPQGESLANVFNLTEDGNYRDEPTGQKTGSNIPYLGRPFDEASEDQDPDREALRKTWETARQKLLKRREGRPHPFRDDKILTAWNGLVIAGLARAGIVLDEPGYITTARRTADFLLDNVSTSDGRLLRSYRDGEASGCAVVDDYAFLAWGLIELYEASFEEKYLREALRISNKMYELFWDEQSGDLYFTPEGAERLFTRPKEFYDGALPSGNSVAAWNLLRLSHMSDRTEMQELGRRILRSAAPKVRQIPSGYTQMLVAADFDSGPVREVVVSGSENDTRTRNLIQVIRNRYLPRSVLFLRRPEAEELVELAPFTEPQNTIGGVPAVYICRNFTCQKPVTDPGELEEVLAAESEA